MIPASYLFKGAYRDAWERNEAAVEPEVAKRDRWTGQVVPAIRRFLHTVRPARLIDARF